MGIFKKTVDPISDRQRALNAEIAALESQIKKLSTKTEQQPGPRMRSTAIPHGPTIKVRPDPPVQKAVHSPEPIFESFEHNPLKVQTDAPEATQHLNQQGVAKFDLVSLWERIKKHFSGPTISNPKLINYLATGSVQGLRPLRYEKRIGRNRFIVATLLLVLFLLGLVSYIWKR